jgi:hypothetical protein
MALALRLVHDGFVLVANKANCELLDFVLAAEVHRPSVWSS